MDFYSKDCRNNLIVTDRLTSGYHQGRGNTKPASMYYVVKCIPRCNHTGADPGGRGAHPARDPPKIGKNMIFWRKIVIFHTKYSKKFRASLRLAQFF